MDRCDVLVVGGGPAGSSCAWKLRQAGLEVLVMDRAVFPRDKVCAGWITPQVVEDLELDIDEYRRGRVFQPITAFRTGLINEPTFVETAYDRPVSYGIRRFEFDRYLLDRSGARVQSGEPVETIRFDDGRARWVVNEQIEAPMLVGAGGHFCPVARWLNPSAGRQGLVVAREAEFSIDPEEASAWKISPEEPELYFTRDLKGYGWCFRKGPFMNIGFGHIGGGALPAAVSAFTRFLRDRGRIPDDESWSWRGHAYFVSEPPVRRTVGRGLLLAGDAAGLAQPQSGEGIRPAVESGLLAAAIITRARGEYTIDRLSSYGTRLQERFRPSQASRMVLQAVMSRLVMPLVPRLFRMPWVARHVLLDRAFLQTGVPALRQIDAPLPDTRH